MSVSSSYIIFIPISQELMISLCVQIDFRFRGTFLMIDIWGLIKGRQLRLLNDSIYIRSRKFLAITVVGVFAWIISILNSMFPQCRGVMVLVFTIWSIISDRLTHYVIETKIFCLLALHWPRVFHPWWHGVVFIARSLGSLLLCHSCIWLKYMLGFGVFLSRQVLYMTGVYASLAHAVCWIQGWQTTKVVSALPETAQPRKLHHLSTQDSHY